jgi:hypothetical protein
MTKLMKGKDEEQCRPLQLEIASVHYPVPEFIDPVFMKTSSKRSFSVIQNKRFGLVFVKTRSKISGTEAAARK